MLRKLAWTPIVLGSILAAAGLFLLAQAWTAISNVRDVPGPGTLVAIAAGAVLALLGLLMVAVPLLAPVLHRIYGDQAFTSRGTACPVVSKCARCGEFNFRGRPSCKECGTALGAAPSSGLP